MSEPRWPDAVAVRAARTAEQTETETTTATLTARPWNVVVHDDPITPMSYVTKAFMEVFGYGRAKAERLMLEVHKTGRSVVWTGARETAELHTQKLQGRHLLATLEPGSDG
jgi:ATP-dependent Clp protease adaptor protein ClpS